MIDRGVRIPEGLVVGEDPAFDGKRFRTTENGITLITQSMIDRLGDMTPIRVLAVASEVYPIVKTGGLADVVGALPAALKEHDVATRTLVPGYPAVLNALGSRRNVAALAGILRRSDPPARWRPIAGLDLYALDAPHLYARPGNPYVGPDGRDWPDNGIRFAALSRMAAEIGQGAIPSFIPDIVHAHDWQAGLAPAHLHYGGQPRPGTVMTVHNLAYQGQFSPDMLATFGPARRRPTRFTASNTTAPSAC